jgi:hypothetical protein
VNLHLKHLKGIKSIDILQFVSGGGNLFIGKMRFIPTPAFPKFNSIEYTTSIQQDKVHYPQTLTYGHRDNSVP